MKTLLFTDLNGNDRHLAIGRYLNESIMMNLTKEGDSSPLVNYVTYNWWENSNKFSLQEDEVIVKNDFGYEGTEELLLEAGVLLEKVREVQVGTQRTLPVYKLHPDLIPAPRMQRIPVETEA